MVGSCQISDTGPKDSAAEEQGLEKAVTSQTVEAPQNVSLALSPTSAAPLDERTSTQRQDPTNSVAKVREAYRTMARYFTVFIVHRTMTTCRVPGY